MDILETSHENESSKIVEFFRNKRIFLTGGTGFIGKVTTWKLLSICEVSCVYLLVRHKSSKSSTQRMQELLEDPIYAQLKSKSIDCENHIKFVEGDCSLFGLGLSVTDEETLCDSVDIVIHCAAAMNMMGSLKTAVVINIQGTREVLKLAKKMKTLKVFVHVSTTGAFWEQDIIEEKIYDSHLEYEDCLNLLKMHEILPVDKHDKARILGGKPTTYALTKAISETIFTRGETSFPVTIYRFPIVSPCWREPIPGWTAGCYGPNGAYALPLLDIAPALYWSSPDLEFIPADMIVNCLLASVQNSYDRYTEKYKRGETDVLPFVYNYSVKNHENAVHLKDFVSYSKKANKHSSEIIFNKVHFLLRSIFYGYIPLIIVDFFAIIFKRRIRLTLTTAYHKIVCLNVNLAELCRYTKVNDNAVKTCWKNLNEVDKALFSFDLNEIKWENYLPMMNNSVREYLRIFIEKNQQLRSVAWWVPKLRFALKILYCFMGLFFFRFICKWMLHMNKEYITEPR